jgi:hypothetical protein
MLTMLLLASLHDVVIFPTFASIPAFAVLYCVGSPVVAFILLLLVFLLLWAVMLLL